MYGYERSNQTFGVDVCVVGAGVFPALLMRSRLAGAG